MNKNLLGRVFDGTVHLGSAFDVAVLREAGVQEADAFLAVTDSDNVNLMAVQVAQEVFGVPKAIARLDDPAREQAYRALDVSYVPGPKLVSQVVVERIHEPDFSRVTKAILQLEDDPRPTGCRKLRGLDGWRIRVGNWRVIYHINDNEQLVTVVSVRRRREDTYR